MNHEHAEAYLRALAEAELRRATSQSRGDAALVGARLNRVAQVLAVVGALDAGVADQILRDFDLALGVRHAGRTGSVARWFPGRAGPARSGARAAAAIGHTNRAHRPLSPTATWLSLWSGPPSRT